MPTINRKLMARRGWAGSGWVHPIVAEHFAEGELAVLAVVAGEIAAHGTCGCSREELGERAGVSTSYAGRALAGAEQRGFVSIEPKRGAANVVRVTHGAWLALLAARHRPS